jgi:starch-binding outer membrane protein, SusD/RagB family
MKKYIIILSAILVLFLPACNEDMLDKFPLDRYSDPIVWSDADLASRYLNDIYTWVPNGWGRRGHTYGVGPFALEHSYLKGGTLLEYDRGIINPDNLGLDRGHLNWDKFSRIQTLNYFLDNIDKVPDQARAAVLKGEGLFLRALFYSEIARGYGGVPLFDKPSRLGDDFSEIGRNTFEETINFIVKDCDEAAQLLKVKSETIMGRATKEAALALKSRILLFAASDLTADGTAVNEYVGYKNPDRNALWTAARNAAKAVMDLGTSELSDFGAPDQEAVAEKYFAFFKAYTLADKEIIWGRMYRPDAGFTLWTNRWIGSNGLNCWGNNAPYGNFVDEYEMMDGSKFFDHFTVNSEKEYINTSGAFPHESPYRNREPRFYASILYDSAIWQPRFADLADIDPLGIYDRRTRIVRENGQVVSHRFGLESRQGPLSPQNAPFAGYVMKKHQDDAIQGANDPNKNVVIWIRYAEILLNYAEASLELGDIPTATTYINMIRNRAGLPDFTGDITDALRYERRIEFAFESIAWYDIRRWKTLEENFQPDIYGMDIVEVTEDGVTSTTWKQISAAPKRNFFERLYWLPIPREELNRAPKLVQNPLYD